MPAYIETDSGDILICSEPHKHPFTMGPKQDIVVIRFKKEDERFYLDVNAISGLIQYIEYLQKQNFKPKLEESTN